MVKNKKMSKSGIAIIVLAFLLVLSMVMGLTGAWFTDVNKDQTSGTLQFAVVDIDKTGAMAVNLTKGDDSKLDPGDAIEIVGTTITNASNVATYALVNFDASYSFAGVANKDVYYWDGDSYERVLPTIPTYAVGANWTLVADENAHAGFYSVAAAGETAAANQLVIANQSITIPNTVGNYVKVVAKGTDMSAVDERANDEVLLQGAEIVITMSIEVRMVQADHLTTGAAYEYLSTGTWAAEDLVRD